MYHLLRPDESMNAVVFGYDPPYELLLVSAIGSMLAVALLVTRRRLPGKELPMLTDLFIEDLEGEKLALPMSKMEDKNEPQVYI